MRIDGLNGANTPVGGMKMQMGSDSVSKNIQNQIANAQKQLQELSDNKDMSIEEKMKKRQEIQQRITDLNNRLRQHQIEMRKEQQEKAAKSAEKRNPARKESKSAGLSQESMKAMISADSAVSQAQVQESVVTRMEGRAGILTAEIKQDEASGRNVEAKKEELAEVQQKATALESSQMITLTAANKGLDAASKAEPRDDTVDEKETKAVKGDSISVNKREKMLGTVGEAGGAALKGLQETVSTEVPEAVETVDICVPKRVVYSHMDVWL